MPVFFTPVSSDPETQKRFLLKELEQMYQMTSRVAALQPTQKDTEVYEKYGNLISHTIQCIALLQQQSTNAATEQEEASIKDSVSLPTAGMGQTG